MGAMWTHYPQELPQSLDLDMPHTRQPLQVPDMQEKPTRTTGRADSTVAEEEDLTPDRRYVPAVRGPQGGEGMGEGTDDRPNHHGVGSEGPRVRGDNRNRQRGSRPIPDMSRWAGILASSNTAQWH